MTPRVKTKSKSGAKGQPERVVRGAGGRVQMIEFTEYVSNSNAPNVLVNKVVGIYRLQPALIKCTFALESESASGIMKTVEAANLIWTDSAAWLGASDLFKWVTTEVKKGSFDSALSDDGGGRRAKLQ